MAKVIQITNGVKTETETTGDAHGFILPPSTGNFTLSNTGSSITLTALANAGAFKINGTYFSAREIAITFTASLGANFVYCSLNGSTPTLYATATPWSITDLTSIPVAILYWDGSNPFLSDELHLAGRNLLEHKKQHETDGARWVSGFVSTFGSSANNTLSVAVGQLRDEERYHDITLRTQCIIGYRNAGLTLMLFDLPTTRFAKLVGTTTGIPYYDNNGTLTALATNQYGIYWLYASNNKLPANSEIISIMGQGTYSSVANAQAASQPTLPGVPVAEWKLLYRIIVRNSAGNLNFIQADDLRLTTTGPAVSGTGAATVTATAVSFTPTGNIDASNVQAALEELDTEKQVLLVSGTNIKTINSTSLLGSGDIVITGGSASKNADGGFANSVYTSAQSVDGGDANG